MTDPTTPESKPVVVQAGNPFERWPGYDEQSWQQRFNELDRRYLVATKQFQDALVRIEATREAQAAPLPGEIGELVKRLSRLIELRRDFVRKREAMNAAIPDPITGTPAERALYDERYRADHEAERELFREAQTFAMWAAESGAADIITSLRAELEQLRGKLRMIVSHTTGGATSDITLSINDICVLATEKVNHAWYAGLEKGRAEAQTTVSRLEELLAASRMGLSVLLDTADDFTEVDQANCEQARNLIGEIDAALTPTTKE